MRYKRVTAFSYLRAEARRLGGVNSVRVKLLLMVKLDEALDSEICVVKGQAMNPLSTRVMFWQVAVTEGYNDDRFPVSVGLIIDWLSTRPGVLQ